MKALVFGGSGFLGSHVADALSDSGHDVVIYDLRQSPYIRKPQKMIVGDILDHAKVEKAVAGSDIVYNFAAIADIDESIERPIESIKVNILGNSNILEACSKCAVKKFVFASSMYVYSKAESFYKSTKQACELLIETYNSIYGLPYTVLRFGSLYGPRANERNFIYKLLKQALTEKKMVRDGDGEEVREYIHVYDAARISVDILSDEFVDQHVIITGNQQMKVKDLMLMIREMLDGKVEIRYSTTVSKSHYEITPYNFTPKLAKRISGSTYVDLGQGILNCLQDIYKEMQRPEKEKSYCEETA